MQESYSLHPIGHVRNGRSSTKDFEWGNVESRIEMEPGMGAGLEGLDQFSHAIVLFYMHLNPDAEAPALKRRPRGRADMPMLGVFAQRGRVRPNPLGVTTVEIVRVEPEALVVRGLDAVEGTPVLDIKPHAPVFDRREGARVPDWLNVLMEGYF